MPVVAPFTRNAWLVLSALTMSCSTPMPQAAGPLPGQDTFAFVGVSVLPMTASDTILHGQTVVVRDGHIAAVGPSSAIPVPSNTVRIDGSGPYLIPGLVDAHVHLEYFDDPGVLALFVANGVTTVRNMDGRPYLLDWKTRIAAGELIGPAIYTAGPILDGDPPIRDDNTVVKDPAEARAAVAAQHAAGYDFVKVYTGISPEAYRAVLSAAQELGMPVAGHVPRRLSLGEVLQSGLHSVEHLMDFDELVESDTSSLRGRFHWSKLYLAMPADTANITAAAQLAASSGTWIVPTMVQAERALVRPDSIDVWLAAPEMAFIPADGRALWKQQALRTAARMDSADWRAVERGRANRRHLLAALHASGARIAVGTDTPNAFVVPGFSVYEELALFMEAGISPREALVAATRDAALLLGAGDSAGTVEVGKRADLILLPANPLLDLRAVRRPTGVMLRGRWLPANELDVMLQRQRLRDTLSTGGLH
jgi:imidazolonepropionase-like amidohydrolase